MPTTFEYVEIPADAVQLKSATLAPVTKILTSLPDSSRTSSAMSRAASNSTKSTLALVPQLLLSASASIPTPTLPSVASIISSAVATPNPRSPSYSLLSTRDPLSVPIMTANFRRFVSRVGPIFWLQDRVEEIVLWKKGWKYTTVFLSAFGFFCYFPRMALLIPHIVLLGVMLGYYPDPNSHPVPINVGEGTADWQANIQGIQNLMGAYSDVHDAIVPLLPVLIAPRTPTPPPSTPSSPKCPPRPSSLSISNFPPCNDSTSTSPRPVLNPLSPPTQPNAQPHHPFLIITLVSFFLLIPVLMTDVIPFRLLLFIAGAGTAGALHPRFRGSLSAIWIALSGSGPGISFQLSVSIPRLPNLPALLPFIGHRTGGHSQPPRTHTFAVTVTPRDVLLIFNRLVDNDRLSDGVWSAPLARVELWENERWVQDTPDKKRRKSMVTFVRNAEEDPGDDDTASTSSATVTPAAATAGLADAVKAMGMPGTWSKANLKRNERVGWTRGRDGWSGVGGEISNLTFSLCPGWAFVETESWRPDLIASWAVEGDTPCATVCVGADEDGWTYTTDTWTHPRPDARPCDGWVTRRRRWTRRVYLRAAEQ